MNLTEKLAYIKGLCEGLGLEADTKEAKVLLAIVDLLDDLTETVAMNEADIDQIFDEIDAIDEDLTDVEDALLEEDEWDDEDWDDECDCDECHHHHHHHDDEDEWDDEDWDEDENPMYEVSCPACGEVIVMDENTLLAPDGCICPNCGAAFTVVDDEDEEEEEEE